MSLTCELSGESLSTVKDNEVVVTPSGHVCLKRLLLTKLTENGGMDPFESSRPLQEDALVALKIPTKLIPPRPNATSMPAILAGLQREYDAVILELFDTRGALEETRQELSQALYQNDAAVRVVARLATERDAARQELQQWQASGGNGGSSSTVKAAPTVIASATTATTATTAIADEPNTKKRRLEEAQDLPLQNDIPATDLDTMVAVWETLHTDRKARQKQAAAAAPSPETLASWTESTKSLHKTSCKGILATANHENYLVTAGKDKQVVLYDCEKQVVAHTVATGKGVCTVDVSAAHFASGSKEGKVTVYAVADAAIVGLYEADKGVVDVRLHPDGVHVCIATEDGKLAVCLIGSEGVSPVAMFTSDTATSYQAGALHHDGLIYVAGTATGNVLVWDFRSKTLAATLKEGDADDAVVDIEFSSNGYHLAVAYSSGIVRVWDLRKQKVLATLNESEDGKLSTVDAVCFDVSGKYLAYGGTGGTRITTVKEWGITASMNGKLVTGLAWGPLTLAACSEKQRNVMFFGASK